MHPIYAPYGVYRDTASQWVEGVASTRHVDYNRGLDVSVWD